MRQRGGNYSLKKRIDCPDGHTFIEANFTQQEPFTAITFTGTGLTFENCNLANCLLPAGSVVTKNGRVTALPEHKGKPYTSRQSVVVIESRPKEVEPGVFADFDYLRRYRVDGTPASWTEGALQGERDLGPKESA